MENSANPMELSNDALESLEDSTNPPKYSRTGANREVHMSLGGFHRSHQAYYLDQLNRKGDSGWMITAIGLMPQDEDKIKQLRSQDGLYSLLMRSTKENVLNVVGSINEVLHAPSEQATVLERLADPATKVLSLTITEKGYSYDETGNLDESNDFIAADVKSPDSPKSALGYIVAGLKLRRDAGVEPYTVVSCDNLPTNGELTEKLVLQYAELVDADLAAWIKDNVKFPNSMVDRITPVTTDPIKDMVRDDFGIIDEYPVVSEDFIQWVLEDKFCNDRPAWEDVGVQVVPDAEPYEIMKVRLLNGSHSMLAYMSYLMGYREVDTAMADPMITEFVRRYMEEEVLPSVPDVPGMDLSEYRPTLIERFANPAISDQIQRLAEDGSTKIPNAVFSFLTGHLETGAKIDLTVFALACWFRYLQSSDEQGESIDINDPRSAELIAAAKSDTPVESLLAIEPVFGALGTNDGFVTKMNTALDKISAEGTKVALEKLLAG